MFAKERLKTSVASAALISLTACLFIPAQIQLTNTREFPFTFLDILGPLALLALASLLLLSILLLVVPSLLGEILGSLVFAVGFLLYLQGNWILWDYGTFDGRDIAWSSYRYRGIIDGLIWISLLLICLKFGRRFRRILNWIAVIALGVQAVNLVSLLFATPGALSRSEREGSPEDLFTFSKKQNVLIILLDTLESDVVQQVFDEFPSDQQVFDGFVFYRNSLSGYPTTKANVPLILSGEYYRNRINAYTFAENLSKSEDNLPRFLKDRGFRTHLIGTRNLFIADNANSDIQIDYLRNASGVDLSRELLSLADLTAFRVVPHFLKKRVYNNQRWFFINLGADHELDDMPAVENLYDLKFTRALERQASVDDGKPVFKYIHFWGAHPPIRLNEKLDYVELPHSRENLVTYTRAGMEMLHRIFRKMKEIGVYDNTLIVVTGDHGAGFHQYAANPLAGGVAKDLIEDTTVERLVKSSALAAVLVKKIDSRGPLRIDDRPVTIGDYSASIAGSLGLDNRFPGVDFLNDDVDPARERFFYFYQGYNTNSDNFFEGFTQYRVSGHSWLDQSWERFDGIVTDGDLPTASYRLGERIDFVLGGNYAQYAPFGFSIPGPDFAWSDRNVAGFTVRFSEPPGELVFRVNLKMVWGTNQKIEVWVNGTLQVADWLYEKGSESDEIKEVRIPTGSSKDGLMAIEFRLPYANLSPKEAGLSSDGRRLGIGLGWVEFADPKGQEEQTDK
ncbi:MAG: sulfatase-like hydrolase/transferase [Opitutaceae bacterium]